MRLLPTSYLFTFGSVYMSMLLSHIVPAYPSPSPCPQVHSLHLCLYSCPAPRFFRTIFFFSFHIYVLAYSICFSHIFIDYTLFKVIIKYRLYSLCCTVCPHSLFILHAVVCASYSPTPILPLPISLFPLVITSLFYL